MNFIMTMLNQNGVRKQNFCLRIRTRFVTNLGCTNDFYEDIRSDVNERFDTSDFPKDHPSALPCGLNKKALGFMKDEAKGGVIIEFVGLRPKLYAYAFQGYNSCDKGFEKKAKGIKEEVIKKTLHFDFCKECLFRGNNISNTV